MKHHSFQELVTRIVHLSTRNGKSIPVTFSGTGAYTNPHVVNIPTLPSGTILSPHQFSIWLGYTIHEGPGHQTHTDLPLYVATCQQRNNPQFSYILNLLEDIRIENATITNYPGDRKYLDSVHQFLDDKIPLPMAQNPDIMGLIYKQLFTHHRNLNTNRISGHLDPETSKLISEIDLCSSTNDCINLADRVVKHLEKKQEQDQNPQGKGENDERSTSNNSSDNNDDDGDSNNNNTYDGDNNTINQKEPKPTPSEARGRNSEIDSNHPYSSSDESISQWQELTEVKNLIKELCNQAENNQQQNPIDDDTTGKSIFPPINISNDRIYVPSQEDLPRFNATRSDASSEILSLKKMFRIYLQAQTKKSTLRGLEEGRLDFQRLYVAATGSTTIFKDNSQKLLPETAIDLFIDMSSSMNSKISRTAAIILSEALSSIPQIKLSISGFTTNEKTSPRDWKTPNPNSGRRIGMDILQFKDYSEPYAKAKGKLGAITNHGFTPLGDAYGKALEHIITRPEPRRIIFCISDGRPEFSHGANHSDYLLMSRVYTSAKRYKIQTLCLFIGNDDFIKEYFDQVVNISNITDLPQNLLKALKLFI